MAAPVTAVTTASNPAIPAIFIVIKKEVLIWYLGLETFVGWFERGRKNDCQEVGAPKKE